MAAESEMRSYEEEEEREEYEKRILQLQETVDKLKQVENKLSGASPDARESSALQEKVKEVTEVNLRTKLHDADKMISILRSEVSSLQHEIRVKTEKLKSFDQTRKTINHRSGTYTDGNFTSISQQISGPPSPQISGSLHSSVLADRSTDRRRRSSERSLSRHTSVYHRAATDSMMSYDDVDGDDTEMEFSLRSFMHGRTAKAGSIFGDSGMGTTRDEPESEIEIDHFHGRTTFPYTHHTPQSLRSYLHQTEHFTVDDVSDYDISDDDTCVTSVNYSKIPHGRKILSPEPALSMPGRYFRVIMCGDSNVGKSSFIMRLCKNKFKHNTRSTLGIDFHVKNIWLDDHVIPLQIWDTAGQERFCSITTSYFRKADGVILLYDVMNASSFVSVRDWMERISENTMEGCPVLICGNKVDLREGKRGVWTGEGAQLASSYGVLFMETSASSGENILLAVTILTRHLVDGGDKVSQTTKLETKMKKYGCC